MENHWRITLFITLFVVAATRSKDYDLCNLFTFLLLKVKFVDFGNCENVSYDKIRADVEDFMYLPPQCFECALYNTLPVSVYIMLTVSLYNSLPISLYNTMPVSLYNLLPISMYNILPVSLYNTLPVSLY